MPPAITIARRALRVGIVGGGLCGFGAALLLQRAGVRNVTVFERDTALAERRQVRPRLVYPSSHSPHTCLKSHSQQDVVLLFASSGSPFSFHVLVAQLTLHAVCYGMSYICNFALSRATG